MFVLLEHTPGLANAAVPRHWDFMIELPGRAGLAAWRLLENPLDAGAQAIRAESLGDHRREYLKFEGEISGGRGTVQRIDRGEARVLAIEPRGVRFELDGEMLKGEFEINMSCAAGAFRRISAARA
jgi:hypothetical protein